MRTAAVSLALTFLVAFLPGCGGSSKNSGARGYAETGQAISKVCADAKANTKPLQAQLTGNAKHDAPIVEKLVAVFQDEVDKVRAITPDPKLKSVFAQLVASGDTALGYARTLLAAAKSGNDAAYKAAALRAQAQGKANSAAGDRAARALGAPGCVGN